MGEPIVGSLGDEGYFGRQLNLRGRKGGGGAGRSYQKRSCAGPPIRGAQKSLSNFRNKK